MARHTSHVLNRRRGAGGSASLFVRQPFLANILILLGIAAALTIGMLIMLMYLPVWPNSANLPNMPDGNAQVDRMSRAKARLAGVPNLLRGKIPLVQHPAAAGEAITKEDKPKKGIKIIDDDDDHDDRANPKEEQKNENNNNLGLPDIEARRKELVERNALHGDPRRNGVRPMRDIGQGLGGKVDVKDLDLQQYDQPPTVVYPYPFETVPDDFTVKDFTPQGGMRYSEYTTGGTPYIINHDIQQQSDDLARMRRKHVKHSMRHAWKGYVKYAFGYDEVLPQSKRGENVWGGQGITLVDALDTLWLMGMKDEFAQARDWVASNLHHEHVGSVSVFETTIRDLGGLLSAFDFSKDTVFLEKALDLGRRLIRSFDGATTGIPYGQVNLVNGGTSNLGWTGGNAITAEFGTIQIENRYLSKLTNIPEFAQKTEHVYEVLKDISPADGLFPNFVRNQPNRRRGMDSQKDKPSFGNDKITFGAMGDSLYEYMLKIWIQGGRKEPLYRDMYDLAIDSMHKQLLHKSEPSGLYYIADRNDGRLDHKMDHLVCFMGGLLALGAYTDPLGLQSERAQRDLRTGKALTYTCYQMYARMNTGISPEYVQFVSGQDLQVGRGAPHYLLRPEALESFYILNHLTKDPVYREWGWEVWQAIEKYCKTDTAYGSLGNVQDTSTQPRDKMESFFLAETLKYLWLLFDPDSEVDLLHKHVFNTEAHPVRVFPVIDADGDAIPAIKVQ